ncbi:MAG: polysaccharide pyruvyl transferase family protein [Bacteroidia bacterium]|nr:polysaccharide pyruvyl transferase family protein [Bacteroidia bacterium]
MKDLIYNALLSVVNRDYVLMDCPYHANLGDHLIWEGTLCALKRLPYKCLYTSSVEYWQEDKIKDGDLILICGGGNFGDVWPRHQELRRLLMERYPNSTFVHLPQTMRYSDEVTLRSDIDLFSQNKERVVIMLRDQRSYDFAKEHFSDNNIMLVPDMAFAMDIPNIYLSSPQTERVVYIRRRDHELSENADQLVPSDVPVRDWPTYESLPLVRHLVYVVGGPIRHLLPRRYYCSYMDWAYKHILHPYYIRAAYSFIVKFDKVYTTRLHAGLLAHFLGKDVIIVDNNYGKMRAVWDTWIKDSRD